MVSRNIGDLERDKFWQPNSSTSKVSINQVMNHLFSLSENTIDEFNYVNKFGRVLGFTTSIVDVNDQGTPSVYSWPTTAVALEAISGDGGDTAAGAGARTVVVEGLDAN